MDTKYRMFIVDDDQHYIDIQATLLEAAGHTVSYETRSVDALPKILEEQPDCVLIDIMMPEMDGLQLTREIRSKDRTRKMKIVVVSAKPYEYDKKRALEFGADGFITKPIDMDSYLPKIEKLIEDRIVMTFWGVRGTLPVPGAKALKYGGNTSCLTLEFPRGEFFIFDAGTGIKALSDHIGEKGPARLDAKIFISHPHWDHINALPFFAPLYVQGNEFEILGPAHGDVTTRELISAQMDSVYFPINIREFAASVHFTDLGEGSLRFGDIGIDAMLLSHPGNCLGYRIEYNDRSICYITDNELFPPESPAFNPRYLASLTKFVHRCDALITDTTYSDSEYKRKVNWGHSPISPVVTLAHEAEVKTLYLFHHDPDQSDEDIDSKLETADRLLTNLRSSTRCVAPTEKEIYEI